MRLLRTRLSLGSVLAWSAVALMTSAMVVQHRRTGLRERSLKVRLLQAESRRQATDRMRHLLGDQGIAILKNVAEVELLRITGPAQGDPSRFSADAYVLTPTGKGLGKDFAARLAGVLLDQKVYSYQNTDDLPEPQFGLRSECGQDKLDILIGISSDNHVDIWVRGSAPCGSPKWRGPARLYDELVELAEEARNTLIPVN